jgi:hypothetical protein
MYLFASVAARSVIQAGGTHVNRGPLVAYPYSELYLKRVYPLTMKGLTQNAAITDINVSQHREVVIQNVY